MVFAFVNISNRKEKNLIHNDLQAIFKGIYTLMNICHLKIEDIFEFLSVSLIIEEEMSWIWLNVRRKSKKEQKYVWWFVYFPTRFDFNIFNAKTFYQNYFSMRNNCDR